MRSIPHDNLRYPVLIALNDASGSFGSGFFLQMEEEKCVYFVTARHVLFNTEEKSGTTTFSLKATHASTLSYSSNLALHEKIVIELDLNKLAGDNNLRVHKNADILVIKILKQGEDKMLPVDGVVLKQVSLNHAILAVSSKFLKEYQNVTESNDAYVFGYPNSLGMKDMPQIEYDKPLLRRGMVSSKNDSKKTIILDCPVFPGNSGGPVIEVEEMNLNVKEYRVIGVVSEFIPFVQVWKNLQLGTLNRNIENSGYSVVTPIDFALELIEGFKK